MPRLPPNGARTVRARKARAAMAAPAGFSLLEMIVVLAIFSLLAGAMAPLLIRSFEVERETETMAEMRALMDGLMGRPELNLPGWISDLGKEPEKLCYLTNGQLPADCQPPNPFPAGKIDDKAGMPYGFFGPYATSSYPNPATDGWGKEYRLELIQDTSTPPVNTSLYLRSWGPDRQEKTGDDILLPASGSARLFTGGMNITVKVVAGGGAVVVVPPDVLSIEVFYPDNGVLKADKCDVWRKSHCETRSKYIPFGLRTVEAKLGGFHLCKDCVARALVHHARQWTQATVYAWKSEEDPTLAVVRGCVDKTPSTDPECSPYDGATIYSKAIPYAATFDENHCTVLASPYSLPSGTGSNPAIKSMEVAVVGGDATYFKVKGAVAYADGSSDRPRVYYTQTCRRP